MCIAPHSSSELAREPRIVLLGLPLNKVAPSHQLLLLGGTVLLSSILAAALQERVLYVPGFRYTGWLALLTSLTYMLLAMLERLVEDDVPLDSYDSYDSTMDWFEAPAWPTQRIRQAVSVDHEWHVLHQLQRLCALPAIPCSKACIT